MEKLGQKSQLSFVELAEAEFESVEFSCDNFLQSVEMYRRYQKLGREAYLIGVKNKEKRVVAAGVLMARPWRMGKKIFRVPGGFLMDYDVDSYAEILEFITAQTREFIAKRNGIVLEISPNIVSETRDIDNQVVDGPEHLRVKQELLDLGYKYLGEYEQAKWLFVLNLEGKTEQAVWESLRVTHRRMLRKAEREKVKVRGLQDDELTVLKDLLSETGSRQGFVDPSLEYYRSMKAAFGEKVQFVVAEREGEPLAAAMYICDGKEMIYLYGGSSRAGQKYAGSYALQWEMIKKAIEQGYSRYNFYGTKPIPGNGVYQFKQGFRGQMEELLGTFALPVGRLGKIYLARLKEREIGELK